jgi:hypothetical protein
MSGSRDLLREPPKKFPVIDPKTGLITLPWSEWLTQDQKASTGYQIEGTYNPPSIPAGGTHQVAISATPIVAGMFAAASFSAMAGGMTLTAVTVGGAVNVTFHNVSGGAINLDGGTLRVRVWRHDI